MQEEQTTNPPYNWADAKKRFLKHDNIIDKTKLDKPGKNIKRDKSITFTFIANNLECRIIFEHLIASA